MADDRKNRRWFGTMRLLGIVLGLFAGPGEFSWMTAPECRFGAVLGFAFFVASSALGALVARVAMGFGTAHRRVVNRQAPAVRPSSQSGWKVFRYFGRFAVSIGVGMAVSGVWVDTLRIWQESAFVCAAVGIIFGEKLAMWILRQPGANRT